MGSVELYATLLLEGRRKPIDADVVIAAHAIRVRTTMPSLHLIENFLRFQVQDKHNASFFSNMSWKGVTSNPTQK